MDGGHAFVIPVSLVRHENRVRLTPHASKLLLDLGAAYSGFNNGYLKASFEFMKERGWRSRETLHLALHELLHYQIIKKSRQGGRNRPSCYYLTWWPIQAQDNDPLDVSASTSPCNSWKEKRDLFGVPSSVARSRAKAKLKREEKIRPRREVVTKIS